jgi:allophanate hydrolase
VMDVLVAPDPDDPRTRPDGAARRPLGSDEGPRVGLPDPAALGLAPAETLAFEQVAHRIRALGWTVVPFATDLIEEAGRMLYGSALLAERHASVGAFLAAHPGEVDPVVAEVVGRGVGLTADAYIVAWNRLLELRVAYARATADIDIVVVPTMPFVPTVAEVAADPIDVNAALGRFASACNLLDLCGAAVPGGVTSDGLPFGVTFLGSALADHIVVAAGVEYLSESPVASPITPPEATGATTPALVPLAVAGLHLSGQPLNHQLTDRGARLVATTTTAPAYRLLRLDTAPVKPGLVRDDDAGAAIEVEVWELAAAQFADFVALVRPPLAIGALELADGSTVAGFVALPEGLAGATDITATGSWRVGSPVS